jgi:hypothetical protein
MRRCVELRREEIPMLAAILLPLLAPSVQEPDASQHPACVVRAVFAQGRLWTLDEAGLVSSLAEDEESPKPDPTAEPALDLTVHDGVPCVVTAKRDPCAEWHVLRREDAAFEEVAVVAPADDALLGIASSASDLVLVTTRRIVEVRSILREESMSREGPSVRERWLSRQIPGFASTTTLVAGPEGVYVGVNVGEYGGGLLRIDRRTGEVARIRTILDETPEDCSEFDCVAVTDVVPLPWAPKELAFSIDGYYEEILRVRSTEVRSLFSREANENEPVGESPVLRLACTGGSLWAISLERGLLRIDPDGRVTNVPSPQTKKYGNLEASFALPGLVLIRREEERQECWPFGTNPLLVAR